ncbi:MAG: hypothetical protein K5886_05685 [Lachnospiraceae bacterium]|nr:hypothetical protein [Lachnospiraceae bacterium]
MQDDISLSFSGFLGEKGSRYIAVSFTDGKRTAEGSIPECKITKNTGFSDEEIRSLEEYLKNNKESIMEKARGINPMKAFMGSDLRVGKK